MAELEKMLKHEEGREALESLERAVIRQKLLNRVSWGLRTPFVGYKAGVVTDAIRTLMEPPFNLSKRQILARAVRDLGKLDILEEILTVEPRKPTEEEEEEIYKLAVERLREKKAEEKLEEEEEKEGEIPREEALEEKVEELPEELEEKTKEAETEGKEEVEESETEAKAKEPEGSTATKEPLG